MQYIQIKRGYYKSKKCPVKTVRYDSGWEKEYMEYLDNNDLVKKWFKNGSGIKPITINYECRGTSHKYIPDFIVFYKNNGIEVHEVKAFLRHNKGKEFADRNAVEKIAAIKKKCAETGYEFKLVRKFR